MVQEVTATAVAAVEVHAPRAEPSGQEPTPQPNAAPGARHDELAYVLNHTPLPDAKLPTVATPQLSQTFAKFIVDGETHEVRIQIFDATTGTMVREVPPENLAQMAQGAKVYQGLLLDHQA